MLNFQSKNGMRLFLGDPLMGHVGDPLGHLFLRRPTDFFQIILESINQQSINNQKKCLKDEKSVEMLKR